MLTGKPKGKVISQEGVDIRINADLVCHADLNIPRRNMTYSGKMKKNKMVRYKEGKNTSGDAISGRNVEMDWTVIFSTRKKK